jgi:hypothetical protein
MQYIQNPYVAYGALPQISRNKRGHTPIYVTNITTATTEGDDMEPLTDDETLRDRWSTLPSWGQYSLGGVAVVGSLIGINALVRRFY